MAHVVREAVERYLTGPAKRKLTLKDFKFVAFGSTEQGELAPVSERHDEEWGDIAYEELQEKAKEFWRLRETRERGGTKD